MEFRNPIHDECWMQAALEAAKTALPQDVPVGAVLVQANRVIAQAWNRREMDRNPVAHAEILALQEGAKQLNRWRLNDTILYVTLEPCPMCASAILQARVGRVVFGAFDPIMGACGSRYGLLVDAGLEAGSTRVTGGMLEGACGQLLRDFFQSARHS